MKKLLTLVTIFCIAIAANAQSTQETITYNVSTENSPMAAALGDMKMMLYYKNGKSLFDMTSSFYSMKTLVTDTGSLLLINAAGQKLFVKQPVTANQADSIKPAVTYVDETKEIAGYTCKKALVKLPNVADTATFWYAEQLPVVGFGKDAAILKALKGMPLEYEMAAGPLKLKLTAAKVSTDNIPESTFQVSTEGYTEMDKNAMQGMMQR